MNPDIFSYPTFLLLGYSLSPNSFSCYLGHIVDINGINPSLGPLIRSKEERSFHLYYRPVDIYIYWYLYTTQRTFTSNICRRLHIEPYVRNFLFYLPINNYGIALACICISVLPSNSLKGSKGIMASLDSQNFAWIYLSLRLARYFW